MSDRRGKFLSDRQIANANRVYDEKRRRMPDFYVPLPPGYNRNLPPEILDPMIIEWHEKLRNGPVN